MRAPTLALLTTVLLLGGCGGDDSSSKTPPPRPTKSEFLARGDAICADAQAALVPVVARVDEARAMPPAQQMAELRTIWRKQTMIVETFRDRFAALTPPKGDQARMTEFVRALDDGIQLSREIVVKLDAGRQPPADLMQRYATVVYRGNALAQGYGFTICGRTE